MLFVSYTASFDVIVNSCMCLHLPEQKTKWFDLRKKVSAPKVQ